MDVSELGYDLPPELIAQGPAPSRDASRLLVIDRARGGFEDHVFAELPDLLRPGDCLVVNNSRVIPARVLARDAAGREVELLFIEAIDGHRWRALTRPGRRSREGVELVVGSSRLRILEVEADGPRVVEPLDGSVDELLRVHGRPPLPPYIARFAAPTAEAPPLLDEIQRRGVELHQLTLHVGPGTFRPIKTDRIEDHALPAERIVIPPAVAEAVNRARAERRRVVAVGTTTVRALESAVGADGRVRPLDGEARLYVMPGYEFRAVDALVTNFHLPRSSLLVMVAAFAGRELILKSYGHAVRAGYRFYSYGDATLIQ